MSDKSCLLITDIHPKLACKGGVEYLFNSQIYPALKENGYTVHLWVASGTNPKGSVEAFSTNWDVVIALKESSALFNLAIQCPAKTRVAFFNTDIKFAGWNGKETEEELNDILQAFDVIYCPSEASKLSLEEYLDDVENPMSRIEVFTPSIPKQFLDAECINDAYCGRGVTKYRLLMVGNYRREKAIAKTIRTLKPLLDTGKYHLTIVGGHSESEKITKEVQAHAAAFPEHITLTGAVDQATVAKLMKESHLLLNASAYESFSLVIRQALYLGLPVLTVHTPGIVENIYSYTTKPSSIIVPDLDFFVPTLTTLFDMQGYSLDKIRCELGILAKQGHPKVVEQKSAEACKKFIELISSK